MDFSSIFPTNNLSSEDYAPIDVYVLKQYYLSSFEQIMNSYGLDKKKTLIIDSNISQFISYLLTNDITHSLNVEIRIIRGNISPNIDFPIFMVYPTKENLDIIMNFHNSKYKNYLDLNIKSEVIFVPGESYEILEYLNKNNFNDSIHYKNYNIDLIPIDKDILTLNFNEDLRKIYLENNYTIVTYLAKAIIKLEAIFGKFKSKYFCGNFTILLKKCLDREEYDNQVLEETKEETFSLLVFDRSYDFITPMCTNYTYEGLIDKYFGINFNKISVKDNLINIDLKRSNELEDRNVIYKLYNNNFYEKIRSMHYLHANKYLSNELLRFSEINQKAKNESDLGQLKQTLKEFKEYLNKKDDLFKNYNLAKYISDNQNNYKNINTIQTERILLNGFKVENIQNIYDELIGEKVDLYEILRLMVIENFTRNGINKYNKLKRDLLNIYGFQKIFLIENLEKLLWLGDKDFFKSVRKLVGVDFIAISNKLQLIKPNFTMEKITDCSYVFGEFCPIFLKLIEKFIQGGWNNIYEIIKKRGFVDIPKNEKELFNEKKEKNFVFVVFIGGITYAEIEGIRFLNMINNDFKFIIITTSILNHKRCFEQFDFKRDSSFFTFKDYSNQNVEDLENLLNDKSSGNKKKKK